MEIYVRTTLSWWQFKKKKFNYESSRQLKKYRKTDPPTPLQKKKNAALTQSFVQLDFR